MDDNLVMATGMALSLLTSQPGKSFSLCSMLKAEKVPNNHLVEPTDNQYGEFDGWPVLMNRCDLSPLNLLFIKQTGIFSCFLNEINEASSDAESNQRFKNH